MISDKRLINVIDLGSGSDKQKKSLLKVSQIGRLAPVPLKYGILLHNMATEFGESLIIEMGTSLGISAMYLASSGGDVKVKTIEGCPATSAIARENFEEAGLNNIEVFTGSFDKVLPVMLDGSCKPGLIFIDGNHRKEPVIRYFAQIAKIGDNKKVVIIDDINYSKEMGEAWEEIKRFENVSVTIDILRMGIVFFRKGIAPENYSIRY
jgi:predicted O-methyltransferase YrrM